MVGIPLTIEGDVNVDSDDEDVAEDSKHNRELQTKIVLPDEFDPMADLMRLEAVHSFQTKSGVLDYPTFDTGAHTYDNFKNEDNTFLQDD